MSEILYRNRRITVPRGAVLEPMFSPREGSPFRAELQAAIDEIEPWEPGEMPHHTFELPRTIGSRVVRLAAGERPLWAINVHDRARSPGLSPFIILGESDERDTTNLATVHLANKPSRPWLVRVHPGENFPPLPWMQSASLVPGGAEECAEFWSDHAYVLRPDKNPRQFAQTVVLAAPDWHRTEGAM